MRRVKLWTLVLAAAVLPVALILSALAISEGVETSPVVPGLDPSPASTAHDRSGRGPGSGSDASPSPTPTGEDVSGRCDEAEHADDPECLSPTGDSGDSSGPGSGSDDDSGSSDSSGSSGSGSSGSNSGPGGGDDSGHDD